MVLASDIAQVFGGEHAIGRPVLGLNDLKFAITEGLPFAAVECAVATLSPGDKNVREQILRDVVFLRTLWSYDEQKLKDAGGPGHGSEPGGRVSMVEGERAERIARVFALALKAFENEDEARSFMFRPLPKLDGVAPIENLRTEVGAREIEQILNSVIYGLPY